MWKIRATRLGLLCFVQQLRPKTRALERKTKTSKAEPGRM
ncbi:hypothetical protein cgp_3081 [Corynebacterium glutamicum MB001]|nr:hypothetical protein cgp_3081 [Corynebacterium glutamicum MB001]ASW15093.1 hypothetical protein cgc1_3081 [Corynebacterium glutamicum]QYO74736.1 hypothetical protein cgisf_3081 [Corynebacterium glutamicum]